MSIAEKLTNVAENVTQVYTAGKKSEYDSFWDAYQNGGNRTNYHSAFPRNGWKSDSTYAPKYPIVCGGSNTATNMFSYSGVSDTLVPITISGSNASVFYEAAVVTIAKLVLSGVTGSMSDWFTGCDALENLTIEGEIPVSVKFSDSKKLAAHSIVSVVEHLSDSVSGKSLTLSGEAVTNADWSTTDYTSWDALVATKPNWTFTLS